MFREKTRIGVVGLFVFLFSSSMVYGVATLSFSPSGGGYWEFNYDTFTFVQPITISQGLGSTSDTLVTLGARVIIPDLIASTPDGGDTWLISPDASDNLIRIETSGGTLLMTGILGQGDLVPTPWYVGSAYTQYQADITGVAVTATGLGFGSAALDAIHAAGSSLDFSLTFDGATAGFSNMLVTQGVGDDGFSGDMTIVVPVPGSLLLGLIGVGAARLYRRRKNGL